MPEIIYISLNLMNFSEIYSQIGHTLLFAILSLIFVMILTKRDTQLRRNFLLIVIGVFFHLLFDFMWLRQQILFFPLQFEEKETFIFNASTLFIQEVIGLVYLIPKLNSKEKIKRLFNDGVI
ncbi:MAG: metal-dependent hydrolase [Candidatus Actinomarina sp.]